LVPRSRLWLCVEGARPLPREFAEQMEGIRVAGSVLKAPLDYEFGAEE
jgi:hypothetical protein